MREMARFEPPASDALREAVARFDCVQRLLPDGSPNPGEAMVRDFLQGGGYEIAAEAGTGTTYMLSDAEVAPGRLLGYVTLALSQIVLHTARINREVSVRFIIADAVKTQAEWYRRQGFVENRAKAEVERLKRVAERTGVSAVSMRLDLGPDPRRLLSENE